MAHVEQHAPVARANDALAQGAAAVEDAHQPGREAVGHQVALLQVGEDVVEQRRRLGDVHHQARAGGVGHRAAPSERVHAVRTRRVGAQPHLHAQGQRRERLDRADAGGDVGEPQVEQLAEALLGVAHGHQPDVGQVDEGADRERRALDHEAHEPLEVARARGAGVDPGGHAGGGRQHVGIDAERRRARVDVGVGVHEAGDHEGAGGVEALGGALEVRLDGHDAAVRDADVGPGTCAGVGVEHDAARDQQVEGHRAQAFLGSGGRIMVSASCTTLARIATIV